MKTQTRRRALPALVFAAVLAAPALADDAPQDSNIDYWVKTALRNDERVPAAEVKVSTKEGIVTLEGTVDSLAAKNYAVLEAEKINGVLAVVDRLVVDPVWRSDTDIRHGVRRRLLTSALVDVDGLSVSSAAGKVTLGGTVPSYNEKQEAELLATEVRGVKEVQNDLRIKWQSERSDEDIQGDAVAALDRDVYLSGMPVEASVKDGVITLTGSVGNAFEKRRARDDVRWIPHVKDVRNHLEVTQWKNRGAREKKVVPSSGELRKAVDAALKQDPRVNAANIDASVSYGHVTLDGNVYSHWEVQKAEEDARNVVGVSWVTNNLFARVDKREDWAVRGDIAFNLDTDAVTEGLDIDVGVKKGVATLKGDVHTWYQKSHARDVASRVRGVRKVVNQIAVQRTHWKSDAEIAEHIKSQLKWNWSTWWVHGDINVTVDDGLVTFVGEVNHWSERKEAERIALHTDGVSSVDNRLTVKGVDYPWDEWHDKGVRVYGPFYEIDEYYIWD